MCGLMPVLVLYITLMLLEMRVLSIAGGYGIDEGSDGWRWRFWYDGFNGLYSMLPEVWRGASEQAC